MASVVRGHKVAFCLIAFLQSMGTGFSASYTYSSFGSDLNIATFDNMNNVIQGVTTFTIAVSDLGVVNPGDSIMLSLMGLQYPYAGDLHVTLTKDATTGDVFNHIGAVLVGDPGYGVQFGNSFGGCSGNYNFDSGFSGDLWATAAPLGSTDSIPCGDYFPTTAFSPANDNLSFLFGGLPLNGNWTLTIYDDYPPFNGGPLLFTPGLTSWSITVQASPLGGAVPEPSSAVPIALSMGLLLWVLRRRLSVSDGRRAHHGN